MTAEKKPFHPSKESRKEAILAGAAVRSRTHCDDVLERRRTPIFAMPPFEYGHDHPRVRRALRSRVTRNV